MHASPEPYALSHFTTALSVFDHRFMFFNVMPVQGAPSAQMSWAGARATPSLTYPIQFYAMGRKAVSFEYREDGVRNAPRR